MKWPNECVIETLETGNDVGTSSTADSSYDLCTYFIFHDMKNQTSTFLDSIKGYINCTVKYYSWSLIIIGIPIIKDLLYILVYYLVFHTYAFACLSTYMHLCNSLQLPVHPSPFFPTHLKVPWKKKGRAKVE